MKMKAEVLLLIMAIVGLLMVLGASFGLCIPALVLFVPFFQTLSSIGIIFLSVGAGVLFLAHIFD